LTHEFLLHFFVFAPGVCSGDLAMPTDASVGVRRGPAVFGGELNWTKILKTDTSGGGSSGGAGSSGGGGGGDLVAIGEGWVMDNRSSYVANRATGLLRSTFLLTFLAPKESVLGIDNMWPMVR
jgi:hypothetical protein